MTRHHGAVPADRRIVTKSDRPRPTRIGGTVTPVRPASQCMLRIRCAGEVDIAGLLQLGRGHPEADITQIVAAEFFRPGRRVRERNRLKGKQTCGKNSG